jgi:hypothetical protein
MNKKRLSIYFIFISIFSFLTIFTSIVQGSYFNLVNPVKEVDSNKLLIPIDPNLNLDIIENIEKRQENIEDNSINFYPDNNQIISTPSGKIKP